MYEYLQVSFRDRKRRRRCTSIVIVCVYMIAYTTVLVAIEFTVASVVRSGVDIIGISPIIPM